MLTCTGEGGKEGLERVVRDIIKRKGYAEYNNLQCTTCDSHIYKYPEHYMYNVCKLKFQNLTKRKAKITDSVLVLSFWQVHHK